MNNLAEKVKDIDLVHLVESEGVEELRRFGQSYKGRCPFHEDKTPSFVVRENRFRCFGCGISGDAIDFVRQLKGFSFLEALSYLGIETKRPTTVKERKEVRARVQERQRRQELVETFRQWEARYSTELGKRIRKSYRWIARFIKVPEDLNGQTGTMLAEIYCHLPLWEKNLNILATGTDEQKFDIYKGLTNER